MSKLLSGGTGVARRHPFIDADDLHKHRWGVSDLNRRPTDYESAALTD